MKLKMNVALMAFVMTFAGYGICNSQVSNLQESDLFNANVEALASGDNNTDDEEGDDGEGGGESTVKCFCKTKIFSPNICSANASGVSCGKSPCELHDADCR